MSNGRELLIYLAIIHHGDYHRMMRAIYERDYPDYLTMKKVVDALECKTITYVDIDYPEYLKKIQFAPLVIFYRGDISLIYPENFCNNLGVVGTRHPTEYGIIATRDIVAKVVHKLNIVSGLALGIDGIAQRMAVDSGGKTIGVLGSGFSNMYPLENYKLMEDIVASGGLVISEYPPDTPPAQNHFPFRNRIISVLSKMILVTEAYEKSGTSITVGFALGEGKTVMCVPYPITTENSFCNQLIYEGALIIRGADDVLELMDE